MGDVEGFLKYERANPHGRPVAERLADYHDVYEPLDDLTVMHQGDRCMDCGIPYCHVACPLGNYIPGWNELVSDGDWERALVDLHRDNNFPEFTGHLCPALCEGACSLGLNFEPVAIKMIELQIIERGFAEGWVRPEPPRRLTGKRVAVVGSGPAGLAAAQQLRRQGHEVSVFERADRAGGLLRYGIPEFKLEKHILDRRLAQLEAEGVAFHTGVDVGGGLPADELARGFDAVLLAGGARKPRDLSVEGRQLDGVYFAMEFLTQQNQRCAGDVVPSDDAISAAGKRVIVIGGGDTGADCVGTSLRQGALSVTSFELLPQPPLQRAKDNPWPEWPRIFRTASSHEEGGERIYAVQTKRLIGDERGRVTAIEASHVIWQRDAQGRMQMQEVPDSTFTLPCDLVLLAMGFTGAEPGGLLDQLGVELSPRGVVSTDANKMTSRPGVFAAGDMSRGQSLIVWAIAEGRAAATSIGRFLSQG
ncbi:glutamate synthase subunit beta [Oscillochloris sp. ZM17-4]|uniref:glutamate synthase subunit beta n=1 Tax=Oscillochloris sp. ZM17-4 TaxID=2866714 RepID=UPI001C735304|nr:glutamate synthase subunit beta [Oscillochloris sp. ZM17-4]MBX0327573.1 glutamate synthase subunit beta [Oscillochloris sp. ZM17-4]